MVVSSAVVGTSLFATLAGTTSDAAPRSLRVAISSLSVLAAVLAAIQTFLRFSERSERHVQAGDWYSAIKRQVDQLEAFPPDDRGNSPHFPNHQRETHESETGGQQDVYHDQEDDDDGGLVVLTRSAGRNPYPRRPSGVTSVPE